MDDAQEGEFREFAANAIPVLHRVALGATRDRHRADDLVQTTLEKMYVAWPRVGRTSASPMAYARKVLVHSLIDEGRKSWFKREVSTDVPPDRGVADLALAGVEESPGLLAALGQLSQRQRIAVLLRHVEDLPVGEVARLMETSESNVKAATREGMALLRQALAPIDTTAGGAR